MIKIKGHGLIWFWLLAVAMVSACGVKAPPEPLYPTFYPSKEDQEVERRAQWQP